MSSNKSLTDRADAVYREMRSMRRRFRLGSWITLIVGGLLLLLVVFYFSYGYREISRLKDPDLIVSLVGQTVDDQIPALRQNIESQVNDNASKWAQQASDQVLDAIPKLREQLEAYAIQQSDVVIAKIDTVGEEKFREILNQNRAALQNSIDGLKRGEQAPDDVMLTIQHSIEKELQIDSENQAEALRAFVTDLNTGMEKLKAGENLNREQRAERRALILARTLQLKHLGDFKPEDLAAAMPAIGNIAEDMEAKRLRREAKEASAETAEEVAMTPAKDEAAEEAEVDKDAPAEKAEEKAMAEEKPADKPAETPKEEAKPEEAKPEEKAAEKPEEAKADKPEEKKDAPAEEKPAEKSEEAKAAEKPEEAAAKEEKPAEKPEAEKEAG